MQRSDNGRGSVGHVDGRQVAVRAAQHEAQVVTGHRQELFAVSGSWSVEEAEPKDHPGPTGGSEPVSARFGGMVPDGHRVVVDACVLVDPG